MTAARRSVVRATFKVLALVALNLLLVEAGLRAYYAMKIGPSALFYGTPWQRNWIEAPPPPPDKDPFAGSPQSHKNVVGDARSYTPGSTGYSKYYPHEKKWTQRPDGTGALTVRINNHGFRGVDFDVQKQPGTIRVLTMGASSTFGYHDRDDETYPYLLERELQAGSDGTRFEVINFAIPHATTDNILSMFFNEGLALDPDVVTFYEGANDAAVIESRDGGTGDRWTGSAVRRSLLLAMLDRIVPRSDAVDAEWWWSDELARRRSNAFLANLGRLDEECRKRGIVFIVATQQFRSTLIPENELHGVTYAQEVAIVREKVDRGEIGPHMVAVPELTFNSRVKAIDDMGLRTIAMFYPPRAMLIHAKLMADLREWAARNDVPLVDVIAALDSDRDLMVNWVHLRGEANQIIARALAREIEAQLAQRKRIAGSAGRG